MNRYSKRFKSGKKIKITHSKGFLFCFWVPLSLLILLLSQLQDLFWPYFKSILSVNPCCKSSVPDELWGFSRPALMLLLCFPLISSSFLDVRAAVPAPVLPSLGEDGTRHASGSTGSAGGTGHQGGSGSPSETQPHFWPFSSKHKHRNHEVSTLKGLRMTRSEHQLLKPSSLFSETGCVVEGRALDYGLSSVHSVQAVGGGGASQPGDGRRAPIASRQWRRREQFNS